MPSKQKLPKFEFQESRWEDSGLFAESDWRYDALVDYLKLSQSYKMVCEWARKGQAKPPTNAPKDWNHLVRTYEDFGNVWRVPESRWWDIRGRALFGIEAAKSETFIVGHSDKENLTSKANTAQSQKLWEEMAKPDCLVIAVPTNQTKQNALNQITSIVRDQSFIATKPKLVRPKYELIRSKLREPTIKLGVSALKMYQHGIPLWMIGNRLKLSPAHLIKVGQKNNIPMDERNLSERKIRLGVLASKLVAKAELIAENAARGLYPTDAPCKNAIKFESTARKVGRPSKPK